MTTRLEMILSLVAENPEEPMPHYMAGVELLNAGDPARAAEHLQRYIDMLPGGDVGAAYRTLGRAHAMLGNREATRQAFEDGLQAALAHGHGDLAEELRGELAAL